MAAEPLTVSAVAPDAGENEAPYRLWWLLILALGLLSWAALIVAAGLLMNLLD
jgi:hypothetical protein